MGMMPLGANFASIKTVWFCESCGFANVENSFENRSISLGFLATVVYELYPVVRTQEVCGRAPVIVVKRKGALKR